MSALPLKADIRRCANNAKQHHGVRLIKRSYFTRLPSGRLSRLIDSAPSQQLASESSPINAMALN